MEFKLPFPSLQDLAVLEIAHSLMDLKVSDNTEVNMECLNKVDKLVLPKLQKGRIREVLKGTRDHLQNWFVSDSLILHTHLSQCGTVPKPQFDVHGCLDEVCMTRDYLRKCHSDKRHDNNLNALTHLLSVASYYVFVPEIKEILLKILKFLVNGSIIPQLYGPQLQITSYEKVHLVFRLVDQQREPTSFKVNYWTNDLPGRAELSVKNSHVYITLPHVLYTPKLFQLHWKYLRPSDRILLAKRLTRKQKLLSKSLVDILRFVNPYSQRCILGGIHCEGDDYMFLYRLLVWPYQVFFVPALQRVRLFGELTSELQYFFATIVRRQEMEAFQELLSLFWEATSSVFKSRYWYLSQDGMFIHLLRKLSRNNALMYKKIAADLKLRKRKHN